MKERPIIFSGEMVRVILAGNKTQTRRVIKPEWSRCLDLEDPDDQAKAITQCPYGLAGDRLWVREGFGPGMNGIVYRADNEETALILKPWNSPIHMGREQSRMMLEIVGVRIERVQDIAKDENVEDLFREGLRKSAYYQFVDDEPTDMDIDEALDDWRELWDSINAKRGYGWDSNPWVWVIEFRRLARG